MKCTAWHFDNDAGAQIGTGDFDCRNCGHMVNNEAEGTYNLEGYENEVLGDVPDDKDFTEFLDENEDRIRPERDD